jgi:hypothetical protein
MSSVPMKPGEMQLTVIFLLATSLERERVKPIHEVSQMGGA